MSKGRSWLSLTSFSAQDPHHSLTLAHSGPLPPAFLSLHCIVSTQDPRAPLGAAQPYIAASYVKYLESAGARVVPLLHNSTAQQLTDKFSKINGLLFPGGGADLRSQLGFFFFLVFSCREGLVGVGLSPSLTADGNLAHAKRRLALKPWIVLVLSGFCFAASQTCLTPLWWQPPTCFSWP